MRLGQWTSLTLKKIDPTSHYIHTPELGRTSGTQLTGQGKTIWTGLCSVADF